MVHMAFADIAPLEWHSNRSLFNKKRTLTTITAPSYSPVSSRYAYRSCEAARFDDTCTAQESDHNSAFRR